MKRPFFILAVMLFALLTVAPMVVPLFSQWSRIRCEEQELDLVTAQKRTTRFLYWMPVHRQLEETAVSRALAHPGPRLPEESPRRHWVPVVTLGPYVKHSPHYIYHSAFAQIKTLQLIWNDYDVSPEDQEASASDLCQIWRKANSDFAGDHYLRRFAGEMESMAPFNQFPSLPSPEIEHPRHTEAGGRSRDQLHSIKPVFDDPQLPRRELEIDK